MACSFVLYQKVGYMEIFHYYPWLFPLLATIFGLIVGSFLNVVIYRLPIMMEREWQTQCAESFPDNKIPLPEGKFDLNFPRSSCPKCDTQIRIIDNVPVISWLLLKGEMSPVQKPYQCALPFNRNVNRPSLFNGELLFRL